MSRADHSKIIRLGPNLHGRDFVIGDIHGAYDLVIEAMRKSNFDKTTDRLFSVGDLVDRGPDSHRCLKFLQQPYVYAVRGNHEQTLVDIHAGGEPDPNVVSWLKSHNGFAWWDSVMPAKRQEIVAAFKQLPLVIEIETERGTVGLLHAEVPRGMDWRRPFSIESSQATSKQRNHASKVESATSVKTTTACQA